MRHIGFLYTKLKQMKDGKTPHIRLFGKAYASALLEFAECAECAKYKVITKLGKADGRTDTGVWVGRSSVDDMHLFLTPRGLRKARTVMRLPLDKKFDAELFMKCIGLPYDPLELGRKTVAVELKGSSVRQRYLTNAIIREHGKTKGCNACNGQGGPLTPACRQRFDKLLAPATPVPVPQEETKGPPLLNAQPATGSKRAAVEEQAPASKYPRQRDHAVQQLSKTDNDGKLRWITAGCS